MQAVEEMGLHEFRRKLNSELRFVYNEAKEFRAMDLAGVMTGVMDLAGVMTSNVATFFSSGAEKSKKTTNHLMWVVDATSSCKSCIEGGQECTYTDLRDRCELCFKSEYKNNLLL